MNEENIINEIDFCLAGEYITVEHRQAIKGLLDLYQQEKEENRKKNIVISEYQDLLEREQEKNKKLEEVIDMLIEDIVEYHIPADFCMQYGKYKENCKTLDDNQMRKKCIRDYYFKKVRGEEDV